MDLSEKAGLMPQIFDNIEQSLLSALQTVLAQAIRADFCTGYFNLRGWGRISDLVAACFDGQGDRAARVLVGMQRPPEEEMRLAQSAMHQDELVDGPTLARLRMKAAQSFKEQIEFGLPTAEAERSLQELARQLKAGQVKVNSSCAIPCTQNCISFSAGSRSLPLWRTWAPAT